LWCWRCRRRLRGRRHGSSRCLGLRGPSGLEQPAAAHRRPRSRSPPQSHDQSPQATGPRRVEPCGACAAGGSSALTDSDGAAHQPPAIRGTPAISTSRQAPCRIICSIGPRPWSSAAAAAPMCYRRSITARRGLTWWN
jgi:hypothetical protein